MDDMFFETGAEIPVDRFIAPRIEVELAFVLGKPLQGPGVTLIDVAVGVDTLLLVRAARELASQFK